MTIILTGGGSGGHITPLLAVARELKQLDPKVRLIYIGQRNDKLGDIPKNDPDIDETYVIRAGKLRRYHGQNILRQLADLPTMAKNVRDGFRVAVGLIEARLLLKKLKPDIIFIKGGFVGVPVGLAAAWCKIPFITHDSDAVPGLANRIIGRWAKVHAVALPKEVYSYPPDKTTTVGVPVQGYFKRVDDKLKRQYRRELKLDKYKEIIFVTGGGQGAKKLNSMVSDSVSTWLKRYEDLVVIHVAGRTHEKQIADDYAKALPPSNVARVLVKGYVEDLYRYSGAADLVIARAGATNIAEFAVQAKACIIVPNPLLTGGHQLKNAEILEKSGAVKVVKEPKTGAGELIAATIELLDNATERERLEQNIYSFAKPDSARQLSELIRRNAQK